MKFVKTLANLSKDFALYVISIGLAYDADIDRAVEAMRQAASGLMDHPDFRPHILAPLEVYGVDAFEPGQLVIKARIKTVPQKQWLVGRELRRCILSVFSERGIHLGAPPAMVLRTESQTETDVVAQAKMQKATTVTEGRVQS